MAQRNVEPGEERYYSTLSKCDQCGAHIFKGERQTYTQDDRGTPRCLPCSGISLEALKAYERTGASAKAGETRREQAQTEPVPVRPRVTLLQARALLARGARCKPCGGRVVLEDDDPREVTLKCMTCGRVLADVGKGQGLRR